VEPLASLEAKRCKGNRRDPVNGNAASADRAHRPRLPGGGRSYGLRRDFNRRPGAISLATVRAGRDRAPRPVGTAIARLGFAHASGESKAAGMRCGREVGQRRQRIRLRAPVNRFLDSFLALPLLSQGESP